MYIDIENFNDLDYIAEIATRNIFLTKPGETLFKLPESSTIDTFFTFGYII